MSDVNEHEEPGSASGEPGGVLRPFVEPPRFEPEEVLPNPEAEPESRQPAGAPGAEASGDATAAPVSPPVVEAVAPGAAASAQRLVTAASTAKPASAPPGADGSSEETPMVSLPRNSFFVGLAIAVGVIALLAFMLSRSGGSSETADDVPIASLPPTDGTDGDAAPGDADAVAAERARAEAAESEAASLRDQVAALESELDSRPIPALPASRLARTIINSDARFVSAHPTAVAVVGQLGGYVSLDPGSGEITSAAQVAEEATRVLRTDTAVWVTSFGANEIVRVDPVLNEVEDRLSFPGPDGLAKDGGSLIVASSSEGFVGRLNPNSQEVEQLADVGGQPSAVLVRPDGRIFATVFDTGELIEIDSATFEIVKRVIVGAGPIALASDDGEVVWVSNRSEGTVARVDLASGVVETVSVGEGPTEVALAHGTVWVAVSEAGELVEIDPVELRILTRTPLGGEPTGMAVGSGSLWVAVAGDRSVVRVLAPPS